MNSNPRAGAGGYGVNGYPSLPPLQSSSRKSSFSNRFSTDQPNKGLEYETTSSFSLPGISNPNLSNGTAIYNQIPPVYQDSSRQGYPAAYPQAAPGRAPEPRYPETAGYGSYPYNQPSNMYNRRFYDQSLQNNNDQTVQPIYFRSPQPLFPKRQTLPPIGRHPSPLTRLDLLFPYGAPPPPRHLYAPTLPQSTRLPSLLSGPEMLPPLSQQNPLPLLSLPPKSAVSGFVHGHIEAGTHAVQSLQPFADSRRSSAITGAYSVPPEQPKPQKKPVKLTKLSSLLSSEPEIQEPSRYLTPSIYDLEPQQYFQYDSPPVFSRSNETDLRTGFSLRNSAPDNVFAARNAFRPGAEFLTKRDINTAKKFIKEGNRRYNESQERLRKQLEDESRAKPVVDKNVVVLSALLKASSQLPEINFEEANVAHELYLLSAKNSMDLFWKQLTIKELNATYCSVKENENLVLQREVAHLEALNKLGIVELSFSKAKKMEQHTGKSDVSSANGTDFAARRDALAERLNNIESYVKQNKNVLYNDRIGRLKEMLNMLNNASYSNVFHELRDDTKKRSLEEPVRRRSKRIKIKKEVEISHTDSTDPSNDYLDELEEENSNLKEIRDYELKRLSLWTTYQKNKHLQILLENVQSTYNQMSSTFLTKLDNLESFFVFQKQMLEYDFQRSDSEVLNIASAMPDFLGHISAAAGNIDDLLGDKGSDTQSTYSQQSNGSRASSRIKKRLKNELDITIKNAKLDDKKVLEFELQHSDLLTEILEGYLPLTTREEFIIVTENNFRQYHNNPQFVKKSLRNNALDFKKVFINTSNSISKYARYLLNGTSKSVNDSGSDARTGGLSSENESGASTSASTSAVATSSRRRRGAQAANISGSNSTAKESGRGSALGSGNHRNKKAPGLKGLSSEECDLDLLLLSRG